MTAEITFKDVGREESAPRLDLEPWEPEMMEKQEIPSTAYDPFGSEETAEVHYKTLSWWYVLHRWRHISLTDSDIGKAECVWQWPLISRKKRTNMNK